MFLRLKSMSHNDSQGGIHFALHAEHDIKWQLLLNNNILDYWEKIIDANHLSSFLHLLNWVYM